MENLNGVKVNYNILADFRNKVDNKQVKSFITEDSSNVDFELGIKYEDGLAGTVGPSVNIYSSIGEFKSELDAARSYMQGSITDISDLTTSDSSYIMISNNMIGLVSSESENLVESDGALRGQIAIYRSLDGAEINLIADSTELRLSKDSAQISFNNSETNSYNDILTTANGRTFISGKNSIPYTSGNNIINDLNIVQLLKVGSYCCSSLDRILNIANCPTTDLFTMEVFSPISNVVDNEETDTNVRRLRIITTYLGEIYTQSCESGSVAGEFTYGEWKKLGGSDNAGTSIIIGEEQVDSITFESDPQAQIDTIKSTYLPLAGDKTISGPLTVTGATSLKDTTIDGQLTISGNIYFNGESYITHAEELKVEDDYIILRNGAQTQIQDNSFSGLEFHNYGLNSTGEITSGRLIIDNKGILRVGDIGDEQPLATREETPTDQAVAYWDSASNSFKTSADLTTSTIAKLSDAVPTKLSTNALTLKSGSAWVNNQQKVNVTLDTAKLNTIIPELGENGANTLAWANAGVTAIKEDTSGITFQCVSAPTVDLTFYVISETLQ